MKSGFEGWSERNESSNAFKFLWDEISGRNARDETNEWNREQSLEAYQRDMEMWRIQQEYNSPSSQMARYQAAGLNPNLIYGQGSSGNSTSMPSYQPASGATRPSGMETLTKVANVIQMLVGLKGSLASAEVSRQRAKNVALNMQYLPSYLGWRNTMMQHNADYAGYRNWQFYTPTDWSDKGEIKYSSWADRLARSPESFVRSPYFYKFLEQEQNVRNKGILLNYQDQVQQAQLNRLNNMNALLSQQNQFFKLDKYIGYGTDLLGSLLGIGQFGLGVGKFNVFKKFHGF